MTKMVGFEKPEKTEKSLFLRFFVGLKNEVRNKIIISRLG